MKIFFCGNHTTENLDIYESKMALFDYGDPEEFVLFLQTFKMTLEASERPADNVKLQYLHTL